MLLMGPEPKGCLLALMDPIYATRNNDCTAAAAAAEAPGPNQGPAREAPDVL